MTTFSLDLLASTGSALGVPVAKPIKWFVGKEEHSAQVYVRLSTYDQWMREDELQKSGTDLWVARLMASIVDEAGNPVFTKPEQITGHPETGEGRLCGSLFFALLAAVNKANGYVDDDVKN
ncbi:phage tail assembly chaperone family protein, TAC [Pseudomonas sp. p1(2021b)]|uniref:phage tail assembly chaperone family protein, TAC n=1 Tax=Pseudomonas sp. p1(2021b) TaxID=2874628 RepID=UPI003D2BA2C4